jgi:voltage-gated potassium channel
MLYLAGEEGLTESLSTFVYFLVVTTSTVGYGDYSPSTTAGKFVISLFVIPFGLMLFAAVLTKLGMLASSVINKAKRGLTMVDAAGHSIIIGWNGDRTLRLVEMLQCKSNIHAEKIVLVSDKLDENPMPGAVEFVRVDSYSHEATMKRAAIELANRIVIDLDSDDVSLTAALLCRKLNPDCHKTAYFKDENIGQLLLAHCPNVEVVPSISIELMARATLDPGSAKLHQQLLDSAEGMNQFGLTYTGDTYLNYQELFCSLKENHNATLVGVKKRGDSNITINANDTCVVANNDTVYYISDRRLQPEALMIA